MPAFTYLRVDEFVTPTGHKQVDEALADLRKSSGEDWRIQMWQPSKPLLRKQPPPLFCLYCGMSRTTPQGLREFQIINFFREGTNWTINHFVPSELVVAYMYGQTHT